MGDSFAIGLQLQEWKRRHVNKRSNIKEPAALRNSHCAHNTHCYSEQTTAACLAGTSVTIDLGKATFPLGQTAIACLLEECTSWSKVTNCWFGDHSNKNIEMLFYHYQPWKPMLRTDIAF